jgi:3-oxoadipate enol-lactonase
MAAKVAPEANVVFLHPIALDAGAIGWLDVPGLSAPTLPGFGDRIRARAGLTLDDIADEIAGWTSGPVHLVGCSMGGMVAMHFALRFPERTASLVLGYTVGRVGRPMMLDRAAEVERIGSAGMVEPTMARWFSGPALKKSPLAAGVAYARDRLARTAAGSVADGWRAIAGHDVLDDLRRLVGVPTTCIAGRNDASTPLAAMEQLAAAIPDGRLVITDHPHMGFLEEPAEFSAIVRAHMERVRSGV